MFFRLLIKSHKIILCYFKSHTFRILHLRKLKYVPSYSLFSFSTKNDESDKDKNNRYWLFEEVSELLEEADRLYYEANYLAVYEMLNRLKYQDNVEVQWRICRVLYKMSLHEVKHKLVKEKMIEEAYSLILKTIHLNGQHPESYKWLAIIKDYKSSLKGSFHRIKMAPTVYKHLQKSLELNPNDPALLYMTGSWYYHTAKLTWFKRIISCLFFYCPQTTTIDEAYKYFLKAEQVKPRFFLGNIYMLGLCSYELGMFYRARYYLKIAADLPVQNDLEKKYSEEAKKLAEKLENFEVDVHSLFH